MKPAIMSIGSRKRIETGRAPFGSYCPVGLENTRKVRGGREFLGHLYTRHTVGIGFSFLLYSFDFEFNPSIGGIGLIVFAVNEGF